MFKPDKHVSIHSRCSKRVSLELENARCLEHDYGNRSGRDKENSIYRTNPKQPQNLSFRPSLTR